VRQNITYLDRALALMAAAMGAISVLLGDADKSPLYFLLAYTLWRLRPSGH
jgi:CBS-domain-containing membrane protein